MKYYKISIQVVKIASNLYIKKKKKKVDFTLFSLKHSLPLSSIYATNETHFLFIIYLFLLYICSFFVHLLLGNVFQQREKENLIWNFHLSEAKLQGIGSSKFQTQWRRII